MLPRFRELYDLTLIDVKDTDPTGAKVPGTTLGNLTYHDLDRYCGLFREVDTVVHLGFHRGPGLSAGSYTINTYEDERTNVDIAYNAYKVAHRDLDAYISPRDLTQLFVKWIECPTIDNEWGIPLQLFYGISNNARNLWGIVNARRVIDYDPHDDSEMKYWKDIAVFLMHEGRWRECMGGASPSQVHEDRASRAGAPPRTCRPSVSMVVCRLLDDLLT